MRKNWQRVKEFFLIIIVIITTSPVLADIPKPPDKDLANSSNDWIDVGGGEVYRILGISCIALGVIILISVASGIAKAYGTAHEKQDLGHFFKMLIIGLVCVALDAGLIYGGYSIIPSST